MKIVWSVTTTKKEGWNDLDCSASSSVICSKHHDSPSKKTTIISPQGTFVFSLEKMTFNKAQSFCEQEDLKLIKILDMATNNMIYKLSMAYKIEKYWIEKEGLRSEITFPFIENNMINFDRTKMMSHQVQYSECIYGSNGVVYDSTKSNLKRNIREANKEKRLFKYDYSPQKYYPSEQRWSLDEFNYVSRYRDSYWDFADCKTQYSVICA